MLRQETAPLVCKFGGTSVGTAQSIRRVCEIIQKKDLLLLLLAQ